MSAERKILHYLNNYKNKNHLNYKGIRTGLFGLPDFEYYKYQTLANKFSSLKHNGYIKEINGNFIITDKGIIFLNSKEKISFKKFLANKTKNSPKDLLIIYDIPEDKKSERNWFRRHLKDFHFIMIQRSVWVGPSPLPKDFLEYIKSIKIGNSFKTFKLAKGYPINIKK